jgi:hypothetical protein
VYEERAANTVYVGLYVNPVGVPAVVVTPDPATVVEIVAVLVPLVAMI